MNGFTFNKKYNTFASYGSDGVITTWNKDKKSKYRSSNAFPSPICAADFNDDGTCLCYAIGYDWNKGAEGAKEAPHQVKLYMRTPQVDLEVIKNK